MLLRMRYVSLTLSVVCAAAYPNPNTGPLVNRDLPRPRQGLWNVWPTDHYPEFIRQLDRQDERYFVYSQHTRNDRHLPTLYQQHPDPIQRHL